MRALGCHPTLVWFLMVATVTPLLAAPKPAISPRLQTALDRFERAQQGIVSLKVQLVETRELALLTKPQVLRGGVLFAQGLIRFDYREPEQRSYLLKDGKLTGWIPALRRVEEANVARRVSRLKKLFALGQTTAELLKDFDASLSLTSSVGGTDELVLIPRSKRVQKRIPEVRLWLDQELGLPKQISYQTGDGNKITYQLHGLQVNPEVPLSAFDLQVPKDATVVKGLQSLSLGNLQLDDEL